MIALVELVALGPSNGCEPESLLNDSMEPSESEVQTTSLNRLLVAASRVENVLERPVETGLDA